MTLASLKRPAGRVLGIAALMLVLVGLVFCLRLPAPAKSAQILADPPRAVVLPID